MKHISPRHTLLGASLLAVAATSSSAFAPDGNPLTLATNPASPFQPGEIVDFLVSGTPGTLVVLGMDTDPGPTNLPFGGGLTVELGLTPNFLTAVLRLDASGNGVFPCGVDCDDTAVLGLPLYMQAIGITQATKEFCVSNPLTVTWIDQCCTGTMGDFVWLDTNGDGVQDAGEPGIEGVSLSLCDAAGNELATTTTDATGFYQFSEVCAGDYTVKIDLESVPADQAPVLCMQGMDAEADSNCEPADVNLPTDDSNDPSIDFGFANCNPCDGKVVALSIRYNGATPATVEVFAKNSIFNNLVLPGEVFTIFGDDSGTMGTEIEVFVDGVLTQKIHTSCSKPIGPGLDFGDFEIVAGTSLDGGVMCYEANSPCSAGDPAVLTMEYTGEDCSASNNTQDPDKATCSGDPMMAALVTIHAYDKDDNELFLGQVPLDGTFDIDARPFRSKLHSETKVDIYDETGTILLQALTFHTSCSQPLEEGDRFGALKLVGWILE